MPTHQIVKFKDGSKRYLASPRGRHALKLFRRATEADTYAARLSDRYWKLKAAGGMAAAIPAGLP